MVENKKEMLKFDEKPAMKGDCLKILKFLCSDIFQLKWVKVFLFLLLLIHVKIILITTYFIINVLDRKEFVVVSPVYFSLLYPTLAIVILLYKGKIVANLKNELTLWELNCAGKTIHRTIKQEIRLLNAFAIATFSILFFSGVTTLPNICKDFQVFFALRFFQDYFPNYSLILGTLYKSTLPFMGYLTGVHAFQLIYYCKNFVFQMQILQEYITNVGNSEQDIDERELFYHDGYQNEVKQKLRFCIKRVQELQNVYIVKLPEIENIILVFSLCGALSVLGVAFFVMSEMLTPEYYFRFGVLSSGAAMIYSGIFWAAQSVETECENLYRSLLEIKWYHINAENKKQFLICLTGAMRSRKITCKFLENYSLNYALALAIVRNIYSVLSVALNLYKRN